MTRETLKNITRGALFFPTAFSITFFTRSKLTVFHVLLPQGCGGVRGGIRGVVRRCPGKPPREAPAGASGGLSGETFGEEPMACGDAAGEARVKASHKHPSLQGAVPEVAGLSLCTSEDDAVLLTGVQESGEYTVCVRVWP